MKRLMLISFLCLIFLAPPAAAVQISCDLTSRYIWRGFDLNPGNSAALQPSVTLGIGDSGLFINLWGSLSFEDSERGEIDLTVFYDFMIHENVSLQAGFTHYGFYFNQDFSWKTNTTQELYIAAGLPALFLSPKVSLYYDINQGSGFYGQAACELPLRLSPGVQPLLSAALGYNRKMFIPDQGWSDLDLGLTLSLHFDRFDIAPFLYTTFVFLESVNPENEFRAGISVSF